MLTDGMLSPWKAMASLPPILYGMLLFLKLTAAGLWLTALVVVAIAVLWYVANQGYSIWALWPAVAGGFLVFTCIAALAQGVTATSIVPLTGTPIELLLCCALGLLYVGWGLHEARRSVVI